MKRLLALVLGLTLLLSAAPALAGTYSMATGSYTIPATPTDMVTICGSASRTIKVHHWFLSGTQTTAGINRFILVKRSAADTTGTFVADTIVPHDANSTAATATVGHYTANPGGLGAAVGNVRSVLWLTPAPASVVSDSVIDLLAGVIPSNGTEPIVLRGTAQCLCLNFAGAALPTGAVWSSDLVWEEF